MQHASRASSSRGLSIAIVIGLAGLLGCHECGRHGDVGGDGAFVGGACFDHEDCYDVCLRGGDYPGGTCSVGCDHDGDCPEGTWCIEKDHGVCLLDCRDDFDCRSGYDCKSKDRHGEPGGAPVCIDD